VQVPALQRATAYVASHVRAPELAAHRIFMTCRTKNLSIFLKFGAGDEARTRNFQLGKLPTPRFIYNNLQNCSTKCTLRSLQSLSRFPILHPLVGQLVGFYVSGTSD